MTKSIVIIALATAIAVLAAAEPAFAAKRKKVAACAAGTLCTGPCNSAKWCNVQVCGIRREDTHARLLRRGQSVLPTEVLTGLG